MGCTWLEVHPRQKERFRCNSKYQKLSLYVLKGVCKLLTLWSRNTLKPLRSSRRTGESRLGFPCVSITTLTWPRTSIRPWMDGQPRLMADTSRPMLYTALFTSCWNVHTMWKLNQWLIRLENGPESVWNPQREGGYELWSLFPLSLWIFVLFMLHHPSYEHTRLDSAWLPSLVGLKQTSHRRTPNRDKLCTINSLPPSLWGSLMSLSLMAAHTRSAS